MTTTDTAFDVLHRAGGRSARLPARTATTSTALVASKSSMHRVRRLLRRGSER
jgi:hypothetical protein